MTQRTALVTGGMGGLGESICTKMADQGYKVITTYSPGNARAQDWLAHMQERSYRFQAFPVDVADYDACTACISKIQTEVGPIDVLVNCAGITRDMTFRKMTKVDWDAVINTNLTSV